MFKVIIMLDCNICGQLFERVATTTGREPLAWKALSLDLEDDAINRGWGFIRSCHYCEHCVVSVDLENFYATQQMFGENADAKTNGAS